MKMRISLPVDSMRSRVANVSLRLRSNLTVKGLDVVGKLVVAALAPPIKYSFKYIKILVITYLININLNLLFHFFDSHTYIFSGFL